MIEILRFDNGYLWLLKLRYLTCHSRGKKAGGSDEENAAPKRRHGDESREVKEAGRMEANPGGSWMEMVRSEEKW